MLQIHRSVHTNAIQQNPSDTRPLQAEEMIKKIENRSRTKSYFQSAGILYMLKIPFNSDKTAEFVKKSCIILSENRESVLYSIFKLSPT